MSKPQNILAKYRTYSYHHILIACDNQAAADHIRNSNNLSVFRDLSIALPVTIAEEDKKVDVNVNEESTGKVERIQVGSYVVILNGMIDTAFVVKDVEWFSATAASVDEQDKFTSLAVEGKMTIEEPRGVRFMNALNGACDLLQSDPSGVIWLLKTIFIGHRDNPDNISESDYIMDLRPLEFMLYNVTGTFDITGGLYELEFAGITNGAARFPQFSRIAQQINVPVNDGNLSNAMTFLQDRMNEDSAQNRKCVQQALKKAYRTGPITSSISDATLEELRLVEYAIVLDEPYSLPGPVANQDYIITGTTDQEQTISGEESVDKGVITFGVESTVEQAIRQIMNRCKRVDKDRTEGDENGFKYIFKIHTEITMVGEGTLNPLNNTKSEKDIVLVVYRVRRHAEMTNQIVKKVLEGNLSQDGKPHQITTKKLDENTLEFDYFFTGKNTDIIEFDIKMDMGLAFLQTISSTNTIGTGTSQIGGTETEQVNVTVTATGEGNRVDAAIDSEGETKAPIFVRSKTPIFPATNFNNVHTKNIRGALDSTLFHAFLSRHAALESVEATVTIHGNPYLMSSTNRKPSEADRTGNTSDVNDVTNIMQNWEYMPGLAKVNIFMPATNATPSSTDSFIRERFWWNGFYYIYGIDHKFNDGQFTQNLHLLALPNESLLQEQQVQDITECGVQEKKGAAEGEGSTDGTDEDGQPLKSEALAAVHKIPTFQGGGGGGL